MNGRIFTIFKPTKINIIKSRLAIECLYLEKTEVSAWENGNLQPEIEINEYSSIKNLLE